MLNEIKAVIFDLDGSLVDSMWIWTQIDIDYLGRFGYDVPEDLPSAIDGMTFSETAVYIKERFHIPDSLEQMKKEWTAMAWDKYSHEVPLKEGVSTFLEYCRKKEIKLGIASSNSRELVQNVTRVHHLENYFSCIMSGCDVAHGKPAPDIYLAVANQFNVEPQSCLVFEDIVPGIAAGKAAGMKVCAVEDEYSAAQRQEKKQLADYYINDYRELMEKYIG